MVEAVDVEPGLGRVLRCGLNPREEDAPAFVRAELGLAHRRGTGIGAQRASDLLPMMRGPSLDEQASHILPSSLGWSHATRRTSVESI